MNRLAVLLMGPLAFAACEQDYKLSTSPAASMGQQVSAQPSAAPTSSKSPTGSAGNPVSLSMGSCTRHAGCSLTGSAENAGRYHATLTSDRTTYASGDIIRVGWSDFPNMSGNWITIVPADYEDNSWCAWFWNESASSVIAEESGLVDPLSGRVSGHSYFKVSQAGTYEIRGYYGWPGAGQCEVIGRQIVTVR